MRELAKGAVCAGRRKPGPASRCIEAGVGRVPGRTAAKDDVLAIQPGGDDGGQEELAAVGVLAAVGHGQEARLAVLQGERLVLQGFRV